MREAGEPGPGERGQGGLVILGGRILGGRGSGLFWGVGF